MATFFGEIGPLSSRAVDDEEIEDQPIYNVTIGTRPECLDMKADCKLLIFTVGAQANAFIESHVLSDKAPDTVRYLFHIHYTLNNSTGESTTCENDLKFKPGPGKVANAVFIEPNLVVCDVSPKMPDEIASEVCELILSQINCEEALILTSCHISHFKGDSPLMADEPFLKSLATAKYTVKHTCSIPHLSAPNFISNFPAAVLTLFEIKKKGALCVINYVDRDSFDILNVQNFEKIFSEDLIVKLVPNKEAVSNLRKAAMKKNICDSNLYI
ncbi:uncharacterized protein NPIL_578841 [Nephila pilipes]|uniref:Proteasome assembly chaperone 1 n=1 Tax=Nephila pilipes TaxID=299642 RepID=A0A8X6QD39_NEPPI|nr:uncharacterized protein NPIL_578841 [Nephila pilipes]